MDNFWCSYSGRQLHSDIRNDAPCHINRCVPVIVRCSWISSGSNEGSSNKRSSPERRKVECCSASGALPANICSPGDESRHTLKSPLHDQKQRSRSGGMHAKYGATALNVQPCSPRAFGGRYSPYSPNRSYILYDACVQRLRKLERVHRLVGALSLTEGYLGGKIRTRRPPNSG